MNYIAFPRSKFHLQLLKANITTNLKIIDIYGDGFSKEDIDNLFDDSVEYLRRQRERFDNNPLNYARNFAYNKSLYSKLASDYKKINENFKVILFHEYTPYFRHLIDCVGSENIEIWEDGLNHYLCDHDGYMFYLKSFVKLIQGAYPRRIFKQEDRDSVIVRDRLVKKNLKYNYSTPLFSNTGPIYFVGQPLVNDGSISKKSYLKALARIKQDVSLKFPCEFNDFIYLPHPRELTVNFSDNEILQVWGQVLIPDCAAEEFLDGRSASVIVSSYSTVSFNILFERNFLAPRYFNLNYIAKKLETFEFSGLSML